MSQRRRDWRAHITLLYLDNGLMTQETLQDPKSWPLHNQQWPMALEDNKALPTPRLSQPSKKSSYFDNQRVFTLVSHIQDQLFYLLKFIWRHLPVLHQQGRRAVHQPLTAASTLASLPPFSTLSPARLSHNENSSMASHCKILNRVYKAHHSLASAYEVEKLQPRMPLLFLSHGWIPSRQLSCTSCCHPPSSSSSSILQPLSGIIYAHDPHLRAWP